eukprot:scaffold39439_cov47-Prasinocladus_malaysianus.AAC.2
MVPVPEGVADLTAKTYRAMPQPPPVLFARMNSSLLPDIYDAGVRNSTIADIMDRWAVSVALVQR